MQHTGLCALCFTDGMRFWSWNVVFLVSKYDTSHVDQTILLQHFLSTKHFVNSVLTHLMVRLLQTGSSFWRVFWSYLSYHCTPSTWINSLTQITASRTSEQTLCISLNKRELCLVSHVNKKMHFGSITAATFHVAQWQVCRSVRQATA